MHSRQLSPPQIVSKYFTISLSASVIIPPHNTTTAADGLFVLYNMLFLFLRQSPKYIYRKDNQRSFLSRQVFYTDKQR